MKFVLAKMVSIPVKMKPDHSQIYVFKPGQEGVERHGNKRSGTGTKMWCREYEEYEKRHTKIEPVYIVDVGDKIKYRKSGERVKWVEGNIGFCREERVLRTFFCAPQVKATRQLCCWCAENSLYILEIPVHAHSNYFLEVFVRWQLAVRTAFKFIMAAFEMSVADCLCKTSTKVREGGQDGWKRMQEKRYRKRMQEIRR